ncbi:hypothetical protein DQ04_03791010 [Trypanosoma grayi]|uniref:hypothetical protein n=1 Tax=Trypanosoma grayi TaxID=71804 RepID=UPI0004F48B2D|nr:hypothetical protein DQ04_03791010 [Trypanosoma grayi]KEG10377.1 hypothetical protein DQ04_03791010 [Trypanosoma grayi]
MTQNRPTGSTIRGGTSGTWTMDMFRTGGSSGAATSMVFESLCCESTNGIGKKMSSCTGFLPLLVENGGVSVAYGEGQPYFPSPMEAFLLPEVVGNDKDGLSDIEYLFANNNFMIHDEAVPPLQRVSSSMKRDYCWGTRKRSSMILASNRAASPDREMIGSDVWPSHKAVPSKLTLEYRVSVLPSRVGSMFDMSGLVSPTLSYMTPFPSKTKREPQICKRAPSVRLPDTNNNINQVEENGRKSSRAAMDNAEMGKNVTLNEVAESFTIGWNVVMLFLHPESSVETLAKGDAHDMWPPMEEFITAVFKELNSDSDESAIFSMQMSISVLKHDQMKDLLSAKVVESGESPFYAKADIEESPLYGPYLMNATYREVPTLKNVQEAVSEAVLNMTTDDRRCGVMLISANLRRLSQEFNDVTVSSMLGVIATPETIHMVVRKRQPPITASLFRTTLRSPRLATSLVMPLTINGLDVSADEVWRIKEVRQVLRTRAMNPSSGDDTASVRSFLNLGMKRWKLMSDQEDATEEKRGSMDPPSANTARQEVFQRMQAFAKNIALALRAPISEFPGILLDENASMRGSSDDNRGAAPVHSIRRKHAKKKLKYCNNTMKKVVASQWVPKKISLNLFAGPLAAPVGGIQPLFGEVALVKGTRLGEADSLEDRVYSLIWLENNPEAKRDVWCSTEADCLVVKREKGVPLKIIPDELSIYGQADKASGEASQAVFFPNLLKRAYSMFTDGYNTAVLLMREGRAHGHNVFASPVWSTLRKFVASHLASQLAGQQLYLSVTQVLSRDCVRDYLVSSSESEDKFATLPFRVAWTPAGPVVRGAHYVLLSSLTQFARILRDLCGNVNAPTEARVRGADLIFSFLLKQVSLSGSSGSKRLGGTEPPNDALLSSLTITIVTRPAAYKSLWIGEYVSLDHSKNLYLSSHRHFTLCVADVSSTSPTAIPFLDTLDLIKHSYTPHAHGMWTMRRMQKYLSEKCNLYTRELLTRRENKSAPLSKEEQKSIFSNAKVVTSQSIVEAWNLAERLRSAVMHILDAPFSAHPMAVNGEAMYDITAPPSCFRQPFNSGVSVSGSNSIGRHFAQVENAGSTPKVNSEEQPMCTHTIVSPRRLILSKVEHAPELPSVLLGSAAKVRHFSLNNAGGGEYNVLPNQLVLSSSTQQLSEKKITNNNAGSYLLIPRDSTVCAQTSVSKRLDMIVGRVHAVFDKQSLDKALKVEPIQSMAAVILDAATSTKTVQLVKRSIRAKGTEATFAVVDKVRRNITSLFDMRGVSGVLKDLVKNFVKGYNATLLTAEPFSKTESMTLPILLDIVRLALESKKSDTYISFSLVFLLRGNVVYDLLSPQSSPTPAKLAVKYSTLMGPLITDGVAWHDVQYVREMDTLSKRARDAMCSFSNELEKSEGRMNTFTMLSVVARSVESRDLVFSSFNGFSVRGDVQLYQCLAPLQYRASMTPAESLLRFAVRERPGFAKSLFLYEEAMEEEDASHFLQVQKKLSTCTCTTPQIGSLASMGRRERAATTKTTRWKRLLGLASPDADEKPDKESKTKQLEFFDAILADTRKTIFLASDLELPTPSSPQHNKKVGEAKTVPPRGAPRKQS